MDGSRADRGSYVPIVIGLKERSCGLRFLQACALLLVLLSIYMYGDVLYSYTDESHFDNATGLWSAIFSISKVFELLDTSFIIFRKKPLIFLHW